MSAWLLAAREVFHAGGAMKVGRMVYAGGALEQARARGLIVRAGGPGRAPPGGAVAELTPFGRAVCENRVEQYVPYFGPGQNGGRAKGSHRRWRATWLAALPRAGEVRLAR